MEHKPRVPFPGGNQKDAHPPSVDEVETADVDNPPLFLVAGAIFDNRFDRDAPRHAPSLLHCPL